MLGFLNHKNKWHRILRRGLVIGFLTFIVYFLQAVMGVIPPWAIPIATAILACIDKATRELSSVKE